MGYNFEDLFNDEIAPAMATLFKDYSQEQNSDILDRFIDILKRSVRHSYCADSAAKTFMGIAVNTEEVETPESLISRCFSILYGDFLLRKIEYSTSTGAIVSVNYNADLDLQEFIEKLVAMKTATK